MTGQNRTSRDRSSRPGVKRLLWTCVYTVLGAGLGYLGLGLAAGMCWSLCHRDPLDAAAQTSQAITVGAGALIGSLAGALVGGTAGWWSEPCKRP